MLEILKHTILVKVDGIMAEVVGTIVEVAIVAEADILEEYML